MDLSEKRGNESAVSPSRRRRVRHWFLPRGEGHWARRMRWHRVAAVCGVVAFSVYIALACAAYGFVRYQRKLESVQFVDFAFPWRWSNYRIARGDQYLATARRFLDEGKYQDALAYARFGLAQSPGNRDGRLLLVDLFVGLQRPQFAGPTLVEGLALHGADPVYLKRVLTFWLNQQQDVEVVALAEKQLPLLSAASDAARVLALGAATASYFRGNYDRAEDFVRRVPPLPESRDGRLLLAKIENERGYRDLGLVQLRQLAAELPHDAEVHRELVHQLRQRGLRDEARRASLGFQIAHPDLPGPRIELLQAYREDGDGSRLAQEVEALLNEFGSNRDALLALADFAANAGDGALVRRVAAQAASQRLPTEPYTFLAVEAAIVAADYKGALDAVRAAVAERTNWNARYRSLFDSLQAIALTGLGDTSNARPLLLQFLRQPNLRAENLLAIANRLAALDANELARQTLVRAIDVDPLNQATLARLIEFDLILNRVDDLPMHVQKFVQMRRPSPEILRVVQHRLGSDLFLFSRDAGKVLNAVREALTKSNQKVANQR